MKEPYSENYTTLKKETEDPNQWKYIHHAHGQEEIA